MQIDELIGRRRELLAISDWLLRPESCGYARVLVLTGPPETGKSSIAWHWFGHIPSAVEETLEGRVWMSLDETGQSFTRLVLRSWPYLMRAGKGEAPDWSSGPQPGVEAMTSLLLEQCVRRRFLIVLDGFDVCLREPDSLLRIGFEAPLTRTPQSAALLAGPKASIVVEAARVLLRGLVAQAGESRILVTSRRYPQDLEAPDGTPRRFCARYDLDGLAADDAYDLWNALGGRGSREALRRCFEELGHHPGRIHRLAREVLRFLPAPGDFDGWRAADPEGLARLTDTSLPAQSAHGEESCTARLQLVFAALRRPLKFGEIRALAKTPPLSSNIGDSANDEAMPDDRAIAEALRDLLDRDLIVRCEGGAYQMPAVVRSDLVARLSAVQRGQVSGIAVASVTANRSTGDGSYDDLIPAIAEFHLLADLEQYQEAYETFRQRIFDRLLLNLGAAEECVRLLERLVPSDGVSEPPLAKLAERSFVLNALGLAHQGAGKPRTSIEPLNRARRLDQRSESAEHEVVTLRNLAKGLVLCGRLSDADACLKRASVLMHRFQAESPPTLLLIERGLLSAICGDLDAWRMHEALVLSRRLRNSHAEGLAQAALAQRSLWRAEDLLDELDDLEPGGGPSNRDRAHAAAIAASRHAAEALRLAGHRGYEADVIRAYRLKGAAATIRGDHRAHQLALRDLEYAADRARVSGLIEEEIPVSLALAALHLTLEQPEPARQWLDQAWFRLEPGGFRLFEVDARILRARLPNFQGQLRDAISEARKAVDLSGAEAPYAYLWGLRRARRQLARLEARILPQASKAKGAP